MSNNNVYQQTAAERSEGGELRAKCERLEREVQALKEERDKWLQNAYAVALERIPIDELKNFSFDAYHVPFETVVQELRRRHQEGHDGGRK